MIKISMDKIAKKLIEFGMDFVYENYASKGEKIISFSLGIEIVRQDGKIYFENAGEHETLDDSEKAINYVVRLVNEACIEETT
jgi:hypothetical protein